MKKSILNIVLCFMATLLQVGWELYPIGEMYLKHNICTTDVTMLNKMEGFQERISVLSELSVRELKQLEYFQNELCKKIKNLKK